MNRDILKLHLGAIVQTPNGIQNLTGVCESYSDPNHIRVQVRNLADNIGHWYDLDEIKLILRPLSSMTEEEMKFISATMSRDTFLFDMVNDGKLTGRVTAESFMWLLSEGFDLFGLIESGDALDGTKL